MNRTSRFLALLGSTLLAKGMALPDALERLEQGNHALKATDAKVETARLNHRASYGNFLPVIRLEGSVTHMDRDIEMNLDAIRSGMIQLQTYDMMQFQAANIQKDIAAQTPAGADAATQTAVANAVKAKYQTGITQGLEAQLPHFVTTLKPQDDWSLDLVAYQPLFHGGKILAAERIASARTRSTEADLEKQKADLRRDFARLYIQGALVRQSIALRTQAISSIERHRDQARKGLEQGMVDRASLLRAEMALADARTALSDDSAKLQAIGITLGQMSGGEAFLPSDTLARPPELPGSPEAAEEEMAKGNSLLKSLSAQQEVASKAVSVKTADFLPQVGLFGKYSLNEETARSSSQPIWIVGVKAEFTLFKGGNDWYGRSAAVSTAREVSALRAEAKSALSAQIRRQFLTLRQSRTRWDNLSAQIGLAHENHRVTEARFAQGQATGLEVVDAWLLMQKADLERLAAAAEGWMSLNEILWANGRTRDIETHWTRASTLSGATR